MSLGACLPALEADGKISAEQAASAREIYDELLEDFTRSGSPETAAALASSATLEALERQVTRKEFLAGRTIKVRSRISADLAGYGGRGGGEGGSPPGGGGPLDPRGGPALLDHDPRAPFSNVEGRRKAIVGWAQRMNDRLLAEHSANLRGQVRNKAQLRDVVRELFGEGTGNQAAREIAGAWRQTAEAMRRRFNAAGGEIGFRADWGLPQSHDWRLVRKAGFAEWRDFILPRLDPAKMVDQRTGQPFTRAGLEDALEDVYRTIRSDGATHRSPGAPGRKALANRRADPRFFVFRSAGAWTEYADRFGAGSAYDAMMGHIEGMARDTAALEILGPNPDATIDWIRGTLEQSAELDLDPGTKAVDRARSAGRKMGELWDEYRGANLEPRNRNLALTFSGIRAVQTATKLGSALLSATTDFAFQASRRRFNGLSNKAMLPQYLKLFRPGSLEDQKMAVRRGLIAQEWAGRTAAQSRYLMEELAGEMPRRLAEGVLRVSLLSRHTQAARWAYGMETLATYTEAAGKSFAELEPQLRGALERYGIDAAGWDQLRSAPMDVDRGVEWISPHNLEDQDLASRFMEMVLEETDVAVPVADLGTRALMNRLGDRGTLAGETVRSALLFKSFGISVVLRQVQEILAMQPAKAARYAGGLFIGTMLMGAVAQQLKAIAAGKDPRPMEDPAFWLAAGLQGGGFGIFGDFLYSAENRAGTGFAQTLAGPLVDDAQGIYNVASAKDPRSKIVREAKGFIPGNNLWYARLAFDRMVADQIDEAINPDIRAARRRMARSAAEQGTAFYWQPGDVQPDRAPDFANALEKGPAE